MDYDLRSVANHHNKRNNTLIISCYSWRPFCLIPCNSVRHLVEVPCDVNNSHLLMSDTRKKGKRAGKKEVLNIKLLYYSRTY